VPAAGGHITSVLEIVFNPDGTLHRVGIARTSGVVLFDHGAYASVINAQPFPAPPAAIQSGDGRVYVHWGFHSNELACGTFNAQPYIIPSPPDTEPTILDATRPPSRTVRAAPDDDGPLDDPTTPQDESDGT
jgi:TonB family protein